MLQPPRRAGAVLGTWARCVRTGVRLAIDLGSARVGVARCDPDGLLASPLATVARGSGDLDRLAALAAETDAMEVIVGLPTGLSGRPGAAAALARTFAESLAARLATLPVRLSDCGVDGAAIPQMAAEATQQWTGQFNPRPVDAQALRQLYEGAL